LTRCSLGKALLPGHLRIRSLRQSLRRVDCILRTNNHRVTRIDVQGSLHRPFDTHTHTLVSRGQQRSPPGDRKQGPRTIITSCTLIHWQLHGFVCGADPSYPSFPFSPSFPWGPCPLPSTRCYLQSPYVGRKPDSCNSLGSSHQGSLVEPLILPRVPKQNQDFQRKASPTEGRSLYKKVPDQNHGFPQQRSRVEPLSFNTKGPDSKRIAHTNGPETRHFANQGFVHQGSRIGLRSLHHKGLRKQHLLTHTMCPGFPTPMVPDHTSDFQ
jgi:hypothetical protein